MSSNLILSPQTREFLYKEELEKETNIKLPAPPEWFQKMLTNVGGRHRNGKPYLRVVSGLDPTLQEWYGGSWHLKYRSKVETKKELVGYSIRFPDGTQTMLPPSTTNEELDKIGGVCLVHIEERTTEHGIPRYIVETYRAPEDFGSPEEWEEERYWSAFDPKNPTGETIDLMGEFPREGRYDEWMRIEEEVKVGGVVVGTKFKKPDTRDSALIRRLVREMRSAGAVSYTERQQKLSAIIREEKEKNLIQSLKDKENYIARKLGGGAWVGGDGKSEPQSEITIERG